MLSERYLNDDLGAILIPREAYHPFPRADERQAWESLPSEVRAAWIGAGERYLGWDWPSLPATLFLAFAREGNRSRYERPFHERRRALAALVVAECLEGSGRFLDDITNGIWAICEESSWCLPAHNYLGRRGREPLPDVDEPVIDLAAGETGALLAWTDYLLHTALGRISPLIGERIRREVKGRILDPYLSREDFWWMGLSGGRRVNNWNPWCYSNCLTAALLLEEEPKRRTAAVGKALRGLDAFLDSYLPDGGCDEGPSYWGRAGGSLLDCLELLYAASGGRIDVYSEPLIANIGRYLYRVHISGRYYVNFADGGAIVHIPAELVFRYGRRIKDSKLSTLGAAAARLQPRVGPTGSLGRDLPALFGAAEIAAAGGEPPFERDVWLDGIQVMAARERGGSDRGLYVAAKGGHNAESHNHNDVGHFIVYADGNPVLVDVGVETYSAKTFSRDRYTIWTMQSSYHNLPEVGGHGQAPGRDRAARDVSYRADDAAAELSLDIAGAYPEEAGIRSWRRTVRLVRQGERCVAVRDAFSLAAATEDVVLNLITPCHPQVAAGAVELTTSTGAPSGRIEFDGAELAGSAETIEITDGRLRAVWGDRLFRVRLRARAPVEAAVWEWRVVPA